MPALAGFLVFHQVAGRNMPLGVNEQSRHRTKDTGGLCKLAGFDLPTKPPNASTNLFRR